MEWARSESKYKRLVNIRDLIGFGTVTPAICDGSILISLCAASSRSRRRGWLCCGDRNVYFTKPKWAVELSV